MPGIFPWSGQCVFSLVSHRVPPILLCSLCLSMRMFCRDRRSLQRKDLLPHAKSGLLALCALRHGFLLLFDHLRCKSPLPPGSKSRRRGCCAGVVQRMDQQTQQVDIGMAACSRYPSETENKKGRRSKPPALALQIVNFFSALEPVPAFFQGTVLPHPLAHPPDSVAQRPRAPHPEPPRHPFQPRLRP